MIFRVSKILTKNRLVDFVKVMNAEPGAYIERETKVGEFWLVMAIATGFSHAETLRQFDIDEGGHADALL